MRLNSYASILAVGVASLLLASPALAQTTGGLSGQIIDANTQNPVADAVVIAQSPSLQGEQTAVSDAQGQFEITLLPTGVYSLNVQREGYQAFTQGGLSVRLDKTIKVKLTLLPDSFQGASVEIVAQKPTIAVTSTEQGANISKEQMNLVPYGRNARNFEAVATSIPGVHNDGVGLSMNGSGGPEHAFIIDGVQVNDPAVGTQGTTLLQDFVQEVEVKTGGYQAEYGRATGGIINVVTKSGGNEFHGSVFVNWSPYEANRNQLGQQGFAIATQTKQRYNLDFGVELGGPILKDKLWFFAGFAPQLTSVNIDRIIQARTDSGNGSPLLDPGTGAAATHEVARKTYTQTNTAYQFTAKLTYLINENHNLALAVYGNPTTSTGANGGVGAANEGVSLFGEQTGSTDGSLRYSGKLLNKSMLVEANLSYHHQFGGARSPSVNFTDVDGVPGATLRNTPAVSWRFVQNLLSPYIANDPTVPDYQKSTAVQTGCQIQNDGFDPCPINRYRTGGAGNIGNATLDRIGGALKLSNFVELAGHHQFKYGVDGAQDKYNEDKFYTGGQFFYARGANGIATRFQGIRGYGHVDPSHPGQLALNADGTTAGNEVFTNTKNVSLAAFAQDTWNIFDKVVLDAGIRFESQRMYADSGTKIFDTNNNPVTGPGITLNNVMPRIGLIYDFTGRGLSKVYASFGRFYEYVPLDLADRALSAETQATYTTNAQTCTNQQDPRTCSIIPGGQGGRTYTFTGGASGTAVDPNLKGQYADEINSGVQYQVYRDISVGVDYVHKSLGRIIEDMSVDDGNTYFLSNPGVAGGAGYSGTTGSGVTILEPPPRRVYDGITLSMNKNFSDSYLLTASYTYSQYRGNYPGLFNAANNQLDPNILSEYDLLSLLPNKDGPLPGDVPNSFKLDGAYVYELDAKTSLNLGGNFRADEGTPLNTLGAHPLYGPSEAFVLPRGSAGRLPWQWSVNLRANAAYKVSKDYSLGLTLDLFNVTNNQAVTSRDENYTFDSVSPIVNGKPADLAYLKTTSGAPATPNPTFLNPTSYQLPFSARIGARLSF